MLTPYSKMKLFILAIEFSEVEHKIPQIPQAKRLPLLRVYDDLIDEIQKIQAREEG